MKTLKISTKTFDNSITNGATAQNDFKRDGYISVNFYKSNKFIGIEIAGFCNGSLNYYFDPKNKKQFILNKVFIEQYVDKCENANELKKQLFN